MSDGSENPYAVLERAIGYGFTESVRLATALTHKSFVHENPGCGRSDNERLEFLGDAVLNLAVADLLMHAMPAATEGELSKTRAALVSEPTLHQVAEAVGLGEWLFLGRGEEASGGRRRPSLLADAVEALIGATYVDGGFSAALMVVRNLFGERIATADVGQRNDWKTRVQELAAQKKLRVAYTLVAESGPDHEKLFEIEVSVGDIRARGTGRSKKEAEQQAARAAFPQL